MRRSRARLFSSFGVVIILVGIVAISCADDLPCDSLGDRDPPISAALAETANRADGERFALSDLTPFEWDSFRVFGPYTAYSEIQERSGLNLSSWPFDGSLPDGTAIYVFSTSSGEPICFFYHPDGAIWRFVGRADWTRPLTPETAKFVVSRDSAAEVFFRFGE